MTPFTVAVPDLMTALLSLVRQVPQGRVTTYGGLASALGDHRAAVWVSEAMAEPPFQEFSHRTVRVTGEPGKYPADGLDRLAAEGIRLQDGRADVSQPFADFVTDRPLLALQQQQERIAGRVRLTPLEGKPRTVAGVDVSYRADGTAVAAFVLFETGRTEPVWQTTLARTVVFPYIPGYLAWRELPLYSELVHEVIACGRIPDLLLVDGNGLLHPRRAGVTTQFGVLADHPAVGVTKHLLCGRVVMDDSFGPGTGRVEHEGETLAAVLPPPARGRRPIYVSPGNLCTVAEAAAIVTFWREGLRLPEPIRRADALSRRVARAGLESS
jgi:deoxyribonuclease V